MVHCAALNAPYLLAERRAKSRFTLAAEHRQAFTRRRQPVSGDGEAHAALKKDYPDAERPKAGRFTRRQTGVTLTQNGATLKGRGAA